MAKLKLTEIYCCICNSQGVKYRYHRLCEKCYYQKCKIQKAFNCNYPDGFVLEDYLRQKGTRYITKFDYVKTEIYEYLARLNGQTN